METQLHRFQAIIGALLLAAPMDARASTLLDDLRAVDGMAREVIDQVNDGPFGPTARGAGDGASNEPRAMRSGSAPQGARLYVIMPDGLFHSALTCLA
jgi:hypothetical protein